MEDDPYAPGELGVYSVHEERFIKISQHLEFQQHTAFAWCPSVLRKDRMVCLEEDID